MGKNGQRSGSEKLIVFVAEGFGSGRIRWGPGTWGSVVGMLWIWLLLQTNSLAFYCAAIVAGFFAAVVIGHKAEKILGLEDPGRIVIDEIAALPLAYLGVILALRANGDIAPAAFSENWSAVIATFILFRIFDIAKPLGISRIQNVPRGWGLVLDDFLAALAVCPLVYALAMYLR